jgi:tubulin beta
MMSLIEECDIVTCLDNESMYNICHKQLSIETPTFDDLNHLVSTSMVGITSGLRFPG